MTVELLTNRKFRTTFAGTATEMNKTKILIMHLILKVIDFTSTFLSSVSVKMVVTNKFLVKEKVYRVHILGF